MGTKMHKRAQPHTHDYSCEPDLMPFVMKPHLPSKQQNAKIRITNIDKERRFQRSLTNNIRKLVFKYQLINAY